jgi:hypothetical protein
LFASGDSLPRSVAIEPVLHGDAKLLPYGPTIELRNNRTAQQSNCDQSADSKGEGTLMTKIIAVGNFHSSLPGASSDRLPASLVLLSILVCGMLAETALAQGPLRRMSDRIRERAGGPLAPGLDSPEAATPPQSRRPLLGRQDAPGPNQNPSAGGRQQPGVGQPGDRQLGRVPPAPRSANYNRATGRARTDAATAPATAVAPMVRQSSAVQPRGDFGGNANGGVAIPTQSPSSSVPQTGFGQVSTAIDAIAEPGNRARLGVVVDTPPTIFPAGLPPRRPRGAMVSEVQPDSAAAVAGIVVGDLIVGVDGRVITSVRDLTEQLTRYEPGDQIELQLVRDDRLMVTELSLAGADGLATSRSPANRPRTPSSGTPTAGSPSIVSGLGAAIGGLFGGSAGRSPEPQTPAPATESNGKPSGLSAEAIRNSLPETLPAPAAEKDYP